jgi:hypothetical protein
LLRSDRLDSQACQTKSRSNSRSLKENTSRGPALEVFRLPLGEA